MLDNKKVYEGLCNKGLNIPIFSQPWWMDVVSGEDGWDVYLVGSSTDIKAAFVYYIKEDENGKQISRALLTQNNGLYIRYPQGQGIISKQKYEERIVNEICDYIENMRLISYDQQYNYRFSNFLPFFWRYYSVTVKYTYVIEYTTDMDKIRAGYSSKIKNELRKAEKNLSVVETEDTAEFYIINKMSFDRQGIIIPYSYDFFEKLYFICREKKACKLFKAIDAEGDCHSVAMLVWDMESVYFLLNGSNPEKKSSQSNVLLIDRCIEFAHRSGKKFDFEGSVIKQVNHAYREYGGIPMQYFRISKSFM